MRFPLFSAVSQSRQMCSKQAENEKNNHRWDFSITALRVIDSGFAVSLVDSSGLVPRYAPACVLTNRYGAPDHFETLVVR
jgi:hypothetical protein